MDAKNHLNVICLMQHVPSDYLLFVYNHLLCTLQEHYIVSLPEQSKNVAASKISQMPRLVAKLYNQKTWTHEDGEFEDEQYIHDQFMVLQRYCIAKGYVDSRYTVQKLYIYFCDQTGTKRDTCKDKETKTRWLFTISKYLSEHEQEEVNLKNFN